MTTKVPRKYWSFEWEYSVLSSLITRFSDVLVLGKKIAFVSTVCLA